MENHIAKSSISVTASKDKVWDALIDPVAIKEYMFGTDVSTDWKEGSPITWTGIWEGKPYEDKGVIKKLEPGHILSYTHFSPTAGDPGQPEFYHTVTIEIHENGGQTNVTLTQDNNKTEEEKQHSEKNWGMMLESLKKYLEQ